MRLISICTAVLLLPVLLFAQGEQGPTAQSVYEELTARLASQATAYKAARKEMQASDAFLAARKARDNNKLRKMLRSLRPPDGVALAQEAIDAAKKFDGDGAAKLLGWAAKTCRNTEMVKDIVGMLEKDYIKSAGMLELMETGSILARPLGDEAADAFLVKVIATSPHKLVRAWATYWKGNFMRRRGADAATVAASQELIDKAAEMAEGTYLAWKIRGPKFRQEKLQIGMVAPNIVAEDIDGVEFGLYDYRGKVVVLDFWGFW
jgi:hypothetical protein